MLVRYRQPRHVVPRVNTGFNQLVAEAFPASPRFIPAADITTSGNDLIVTVDVPGISQQDLNVALQDRRLVISGRREETPTAAGDQVISRGAARGSFTRTFTVPAGTTPDQVSADLHNGQLTVRVSEATAAPQPQSIAISTPDEAPAPGPEAPENN